jgi:hypothetical protein
MSTYLAARLRAIAADPTPANIAELPRLAVQVQRLEVAMDELVGQAKAEELMAPSWRRNARL